MKRRKSEVGTHRAEVKWRCSAPCELCLGVVLVELLVLRDPLASSGEGAG